MSPEQVVGGQVDARSDVFALGIILHELATGVHPFIRGDAAETMAAIVRDRPASGARPLESVAGLDRLVGRLLAKAASERVQTVSELRVELEAFRERLWRDASPAEAVTSAPGRPLERTPFVGRDPERTELMRLLDRMLGGNGGMALIGGEPGVGKTRLARELMRGAHERSSLCLTGHCFEMDGTPPFAPFIESMEEAVRLAPQATRRALGDVAGEIAAVVPSLRRAFGDIPASPEVRPDLQRGLVFGAYIEYLRRASSKSPIVLLFDDLHWADESTLELVGHLAPQLSSMRLLLIGTYRDVELNVRRPFANALEGLVRQRLAVRISLRRLSESGVQQMLAAMGGSAPPSGLTKAVFRETEGNPFFVEEVYAHLAEEARLFDERGAWKADLRLDTIEVPQGVRLVIGRRMERLGELAIKVLTSAAVIGRMFPLDVLEAVADASPEDVLDAVDEAERAQLVSSTPGVREARYEFVHELIRTTLLGDLSMPRRQRLHLKIADVLERLRGRSLDSHASVVAHHLYQAGAGANAERTAKFLILAIRRAIAAGAFEEVLEASDRLVSLELDAGDPQLAEAFEHRGAALIGLHRPDEGLAALQRARDLYEQRRDDAGIARVAYTIATTLVYVGAPFADAVAAVERGLGALSPESVVERVGLSALLTPASLNVVPADVAWSRLEDALAVAESLGDSALLGSVLERKTVAHHLCGEPEAALEVGRRSLSLLREEALAERADLLAHLVAVNFLSGRLAEVEALAPQVHAVAARAGLHGVIQMTERHVRACKFLLLAGDLRGFLTSVPDWQYSLVDKAFARFHLGEVAETVDMLRGALAQPLPSLVHGGIAEAWLSAALAFSQRFEEMQNLAPSIEPWLPVLGRRNLIGAWITLDAWVIALALAGERERVAVLYPLCAAYAKAIVVSYLFGTGPGHSQTVAGIAAHAAGLSDKSREHFETAIRQADELPHRLLQPTARFWYGRTLADHADPAERVRGRALIEAAAADFRLLEMVPYAELAERHLR
jgi:tetratricopeptide (TPR) repeat protein